LQNLKNKNKKQKTIRYYPAIFQYYMFFRVKGKKYFFIYYNFYDS